MADLGPSLVMGTLTVTKNVITPRVNGLIMSGYHPTESYFPSVNGSDGIIQLRQGLDFNHYQWGKTSIRVGSGGSIIIDKQIQAPYFYGALSGNATTATKFQTGRKINGAYFDGSSDVTTYVWGIARNVTIGNKTISVNGSLNVKWSLNDIGAAPSTHTHGTHDVKTLGNFITVASDGKISVNSSVYRQAGMYGIYDSNRVGHIWSMGTAYVIDRNGANFGNLYGLAYKHTNNTTGGTMAGGHQMVWCANGVPKSAMGEGGFWTAGQYVGNGGGLTSLNASNLSSGTVSAARLSGTYNISVSGNAATTTKLATARTINGTSFNGSADIVTSYWGAARTIKIGNTGKSVNGSANVSWTLAEIGLGNVPNTVHTSSATGSTVPVRDSSADIHTRLFRSNYANQSTISGAIAFRVNNGSDNYIRFCSNVGAIRTWLGVMSQSDADARYVQKSGTGSGDMNVDGVIRAKAFIRTSDANKKKVTSPVTVTQEQLDSLELVYFRWLGGSDVGKEDSGVLAQQVQKVFPYCVYEIEEDGVKSLTVDYGKFAAHYCIAQRKLDRLNKNN